MLYVQHLLFGGNYIRHITAKWVMDFNLQVRSLLTLFKQFLASARKLASCQAPPGTSMCGSAGAHPACLVSRPGTDFVAGLPSRTTAAACWAETAPAPQTDRLEDGNHGCAGAH